MCCGVASVSASMMQHWLLGLELWHEINSTPWCGHSTLKCVVKVTCPLPYMLLMESDICTGCLSLSSYVLKQWDNVTIQHIECLCTSLDFEDPFDATVFTVSCLAFWSQAHLGELLFEKSFD